MLVQAAKALERNQGHQSIRVFWPFHYLALRVMLSLPQPKKKECRQPWTQWRSPKMGKPVYGVLLSSLSNIFIDHHSLVLTIWSMESSTLCMCCLQATHKELDLGCSGWLLGWVLVVLKSSHPLGQLLLTYCVKLCSSQINNSN